MNKTKIDWCDSSWNPVTGCLNNCEYCYARGIAKRFGEKDCGYTSYPLPNEQAIISLTHAISKKDKKILYPYGFHPTFHRYRLDEPQRMKKPQTIFVCSMADLFGDWVPDEWIAEVFKACERAPQHRYLFLTKNPDRYVFDNFISDFFERNKNCWFGQTVTGLCGHLCGLPNIASCHANIFLSIEPLLEDLEDYLILAGIKWVIIGAESGRRKDKVVPKREWIESIVKQCKVATIPVFMKQGEKISGNEKDGTAKYFMRELMGKDFIQQLPWGL